MLYYEVQI